MTPVYDGMHQVHKKQIRKRREREKVTIEKFLEVNTFIEVSATQPNVGPFSGRLSSILVCELNFFYSDDWALYLSDFVFTRYYIIIINYLNIVFVSKLEYFFDLNAAKAADVQNVWSEILAAISSWIVWWKTDFFVASAPFELKLRWFYNNVQEFFDWNRTRGFVLPSRWEDHWATLRQLA